MSELEAVETMEAIEAIENQRRIQLTWKAQMLIGGAIVGAILGVGTSFLMARTSEEQRGGPPEFQTMEVLKIAISLFGLIRGIAALGDD